jgi:hypothetical protein
VVIPRLGLSGKRQAGSLFPFPRVFLADGVEAVHLLEEKVTGASRARPLRRRLASRLWTNDDVRLVSGLSRYEHYHSTMTTQYLTDERGEKVAVVIPIADFDDLMEDVADLACVAERRDEGRISLAEPKQQLMADGLLPH